MFSKLLVSGVVYREITHFQKPYAQGLHKYVEEKTISVKNKLAVSVLSKELDSGEAEVIIFALENSCRQVLIDEHKGRRVARSNGLILVGTPGALLCAKEKKYITEIKPLMDQLIQEKIRISKSLYEKVLRTANEYE